MTTRKINVEAIEITGARGFDFIRVLFSDEAPRRGSVIIYCDHGCFSSNWNAMEDRGVKHFFLEAPLDYLTGSLVGNNPTEKPSTYRNRQNMVMRLVDTVRVTLRQPDGESETKEEL